jgi:hypothetical protein
LTIIFVHHDNTEKTGKQFERKIFADRLDARIRKINDEFLEQGIRFLWNKLFRNAARNDYIIIQNGTSDNCKAVEYISLK